MTEIWLVFNSVVLLSYIYYVFILCMIFFFFMWSLCFLFRKCIFILLATSILWTFFNALKSTRHLVFDVENTISLVPVPEPVLNFPFCPAYVCGRVGLSYLYFVGTDVSILFFYSVYTAFFCLFCLRSVIKHSVPPLPAFLLIFVSHLHSWKPVWYILSSCFCQWYLMVGWAGCVIFGS